MRRTQTLLAYFLLSLNGVIAQSGSWTNQAGHVLSAVPVEIKGMQIVFRKGAESVVYPLSVFLPSEQKRLKDALGIVEVPPGLADAHAQAQRMLKRLHLLHAGGRLSDEAYRDACSKACQGFRSQAAPFVEKGIITPRDVSRLIQFMIEE